MIRAILIRVNNPDAHLRQFTPQFFKIKLSICNGFLNAGAQGNKRRALPHGLFVQFVRSPAVVAPQVRMIGKIHQSVEQLLQLPVLQLHTDLVQFFYHKVQGIFRSRPSDTRSEFIIPDNLFIFRTAAIFQKPLCFLLISLDIPAFTAYIIIVNLST